MNSAQNLPIYWNVGTGFQTTLRTLVGFKEHTNIQIDTYMYKYTCVDMYKYPKMMFVKGEKVDLLLIKG